MKTRRLTSWGTAALMLAAVGCGSSGGTGGTAGKGGAGTGGGAAGKGGSSGAAGATGGSGTGTGGGSGGSSAGGGTTGTGGASTGGAGGASTGGAGGASTGGAGGHAGASGGAGGAFATSTLLVDDDNSDNNDDPTNASPVVSYSDTLFTSLLGGEQITHATYVVPSDGSANPTGPTFTQLSGVSTIIWYTGDNDTGVPPTLGATQETTLENWLDSGNKTLIIFSENLIFDLGLAWSATNGDSFAANYLGLTGGENDVDTLGGSDDLADESYVATGVSTVPAFNGLSFAIDADSNILSTADAVNPGSGTVALLTVQADPTDSGTNSATPVASVHTKGTSKIIYVGIPIEDVHGTPSNTSTQLFHACLKYAGLVTN